MIPSNLLLRIAQREGAVVLVVGAGCSCVPPTNLPLARELAEETHRRLVADGILRREQCPNPSDLSSVADAVFAATGSHNELVERIGPQRFRNAEPNKGYLLAAALLRERAISCVMTLNFDCAVSSALSQVGAGNDVAVILGPKDHSHIGVANVIYLHGSAFAPAVWILRTRQLEDEWRDAWEEVVVQRFASSPEVAFVGLGSVAAVLTETTRRIRAAIPVGVNVYQVDPADRAHSDFFQALGIPDDAYIRMGWEEFMDGLAQRVVQEQEAELVDRCRRLIVEQQLDQENCDAVCNRMMRLGLLGLGRLRARWLLEQTSYRPHIRIELDWIADLLLCIALVERITGTVAHFSDDCAVEFREETLARAAVIVVSGRGIHRWVSLEARLQGLRHTFRGRGPQPRYALVAGVQGARPQGDSPPDSIVPNSDPHDLIPEAPSIAILSATELRETPELANQVITT